MRRLNKWILILCGLAAAFLVASVGRASETRLVIEAGEYQHLSNSTVGPPAIFRIVTVEEESLISWVSGAISIGEWSRAPVVESEAAFIVGDLFLMHEIPNGLGIRGAFGVALLDQTTSRLSTRYQFHLSLHVTLDFGLVGFRYGCHHFSNGNKIHGYKRSQRNRGEEFCGFALAGRF